MPSPCGLKHWLKRARGANVANRPPSGLQVLLLREEPDATERFLAHIAPVSVALARTFGSDRRRVGAGALSRMPDVLPGRAPGTCGGPTLSSMRPTAASGRGILELTDAHGSGRPPPNRMRYCPWNCVSAFNDKTASALRRRRQSSLRAAPAARTSSTHCLP
jgi:hypothetical protein